MSPDFPEEQNDSNQPGDEVPAASEWVGWPKPKLYLIGYGPGDRALMTSQAAAAISQATRVFSTKRGAQDDLDIKAMSLRNLYARLRQPEWEPTAVLVSGDPGFYSITRTLIDDFAKTYDIEVIPGISSIAYLSAKMQIAYQDAVLTSLDSRNELIVPIVAYNSRVFVLTGPGHQAAHICHHLDRYGLGNVRVTVGEFLSYPDERITTDTASELKDLDFDDLSVVYIQNDAAAEHSLPLENSEFFGQRSQSANVAQRETLAGTELRWLVVARMKVKPTDIVYTMTTDAGAMAVELARRAYRGLVYTIEDDVEQRRLIERNRKRHRAFNLEIVAGKPVQAFSMLPIPDKVLINAEAFDVEAALRYLLALNPETYVVLYMQSLNSLLRTADCLDRLGFRETDMVMLNTAQAQQPGKEITLAINNPVFIVYGQFIDLSHDGELSVADDEEANPGHDESGENQFGRRGLLSRLLSRFELAADDDDANDD